MQQSAIGRFALVAACGASLLALASCGRAGDGSAADSSTGSSAASAPGIPTAATKNTTRIWADSPEAVAAGAARAVYPARKRNQRPLAVVLADSGDWQSAIAGASLMAAPLHAPMLLSSGGKLPAVTQSALSELSPTGAGENGPQVIRLGNAAALTTLKTQPIAGDDPYTLAANIDAYHARIAGRWSSSVVVASGEQAAMAMPAAAWAAKSGDAVLFSQRNSLPAATTAAIKAHGKPKIYVLGPSTAISEAVVGQLGKLGAVTRIGSRTPSANAIAFARFSDSGFGWGVIDPGHGMVFANPSNGAVAGAAAPLSASGSYGPLLLVGQGGQLPSDLRNYLRDIRPGYSSDPVRGVYNHGWIIGDTAAVSDLSQATVDSLLEIAPVTRSAATQ
ncbi:MAG: hypothetical protein F2813_04880 [Actinobacteria bacterium]|uniref:Unannotated protein n=1 Tax=freshwater metagenome TaxID=449393 RepID=A0A6J5ZVD8_9ZZZZ|nr:hypothetical protein [Actinomycetota bacterium]